jgi:hypothetical protein
LNCSFSLVGECWAQSKLYTSLFQKDISDISGLFAGLILQQEVSGMCSVAICQRGACNASALSCDHLAGALETGTAFGDAAVLHAAVLLRGIAAGALPTARLGSPGSAAPGSGRGAGWQLKLSCVKSRL